MRVKRINSLLMVLLMAFSMFFSMSGVALAAEMEGDGTEASPYLIKTVDDLYSITNKMFAHYKLMNDLDLENEIRQPLSTFKGVLDGNGYSISNLKVEGTADSGFFSIINGAEIKNISFIDAEVSSSGSGHAGVLVGASYSSKITNCYILGSKASSSGNRTGGISGQDSSSTFYQCLVYDIDVSGGMHSGGIVGVGVNSKVSQCAVILGTIQGDYAAGISRSGSNSSAPTTITDSYSDNVVLNGTKGSGGVGYDDVNIKNCYSASKPEGVSPKGLLNTGNIVNSYFDKDIIEYTATETQARTTAEMYTKSTYEDWDFENVWTIDEGKDYPRLRFEPESIRPEKPQTRQLKVVLEPTEELQLSVDDDLSENTKLVWTSSNASVATVNNDGVITAVKAGNTTITVKSNDGSYTDKIKVLVVNDAKEYRLAIDLKVGEKCRLTIDDAEDLVGGWTSMDPTIVTVTDKGRVTAVAKGLTVITAVDENNVEVGQVYIRVR